MHILPIMDTCLVLRYSVFLHPNYTITMQAFLSLTQKLDPKSPLVLLIKNLRDLPPDFATPSELTFLRKRWKDKKNEIIPLHRLDKVVYLVKADTDGKTVKQPEKWRRKGESILAGLSDQQAVEVTLADTGSNPLQLLAMAEGMVLGSYQFLKYRKDALEKESALRFIHLKSDQIQQEEVDQMNILCEAVYRCRDLVNEPLSALNAEGLAASFEKMAHDAGMKVEVLNKQKIESLRMGGLLAVNQGSIDPPTFTILEYKPEKPVNSKPLVLIGKGVVYDTGGLSLKPSNSMDTMKCDMAGAAAVASATYAIAKSRLPVHVIALMPATDNRPDGNAYVPGDVIHMMDGTTVEVLNTDAEGRLLLADALSYAKNLDPLLVIDLATLTGAAHAAIGKYGMVGMHNDAGPEMERLKEAGLQVHERIAEFPFWDEYADLLKSEIADLKNIGGPYAGAITAGKFLQHFTGYPWIHLDIAGPAFQDKKDSYRPSGGTGTGVRLLFQYASMLLRPGKKSVLLNPGRSDKQS